MRRGRRANNLRAAEPRKNVFGGSKIPKNPKPGRGAAKFEFWRFWSDSARNPPALSRESPKCSFFWLKADHFAGKYKVFCFVSKLTKKWPAGSEKPSRHSPLCGKLAQNDSRTGQAAASARRVSQSFLSSFWLSDINNVVFSWTSPLSKNIAPVTNRKSPVSPQPPQFGIQWGFVRIC